jgi:hypothetical protein
VKFRKKPSIIDAVRVTAADYNGKTWDGCPFSEVPEWLKNAIENGTITPIVRNATDYSEWKIKTLEGELIASPGDWIIKGKSKDQGVHFRPVKPDYFSENCELAEE